MVPTRLKKDNAPEKQNYSIWCVHQRNDKFIAFYYLTTCWKVFSVMGEVEAVLYYYIVVLVSVFKVHIKQRCQTCNQLLIIFSIYIVFSINFFETIHDTFFFFFFKNCNFVRELLVCTFFSSLKKTFYSITAMTKN